jgi:hypothetical protein
MSRLTSFAGNEELCSGKRPESAKRYNRQASAFEEPSDIPRRPELGAVDPVEERTSHENEWNIYVRQHEEAARAQHSRDLANAGGLLAPMMKGHGTERDVEGGSPKWQRRRIPLLEAEAGISLVLPLRLDDHLLRDIDARQLYSTPADSRSFEQAAGPATNIEDILRRAACSSKGVQYGIMDGPEDEPLTDTAIIVRGTVVEGSHGLSIA